jgi:short-subunit dehydrogenase
MSGIDILIANAGVGAPTTIQPFNVETQEKMIKVNLLGVIYCIEAVLQTMLDSGKGQGGGNFSMNQPLQGHSG